MATVTLTQDQLQMMLAMAATTAAEAVQKQYGAPIKANKPNKAIKSNKPPAAPAAPIIKPNKTSNNHHLHVEYDVDYTDDSASFYDDEEEVSDDEEEDVRCWATTKNGDTCHNYPWSEDTSGLCRAHSPLKKKKATKSEPKKKTSKDCGQKTKDGSKCRLKPWKQASNGRCYHHQ